MIARMIAAMPSVSKMVVKRLVWAKSVSVLRKPVDGVGWGSGGRRAGQRLILIQDVDVDDLFSDVAHCFFLRLISYYLFISLYEQSCILLTILKNVANLSPVFLLTLMMPLCADDIFIYSPSVSLLPFMFKKPLYLFCGSI